MELFFMMTAMLALLGPIALGRARCIRIAPRLRHPVKCVFQGASQSATWVRLPRERDVHSAVAAWTNGSASRFKRQQSARCSAALLRRIPA